MLLIRKRYVFGNQQNRRYDSEFRRLDRATELTWLYLGCCVGSSALSREGDQLSIVLQRIAMMLDQQRRFVADAAHELRSPITALSVQAENLAHAELPQESRKRFAL